MQGSDKRSLVRQMFGRIAPGYDLANRMMTFGQDLAWRARAAELALSGTSPSPRVLDLATGTGDLALALARNTPRARIVGLDLTGEMLGLARKKVESAKLQTAIELVWGDTLDLPFPDNTFDAITSAFMLRNLADLPRGFTEMVRVARPGGRVVALEITRPALPVWRELFHFYFYRVTPLLGGLVTGDMAAYRYLPNSLTYFPSAAELAGTMTSTGMEGVRYELLNLGTVAIHVGFKPKG